MIEPLTSKSAVGEKKATIPFEVTAPSIKWVPVPPRKFTTVLPSVKLNTISLPLFRLSSSQLNTVFFVSVKTVRVPVAVDSVVQLAVPGVVRTGSFA